MISYYCIDICDLFKREDPLKTKGICGRQFVTSSHTKEKLMRKLFAFGIVVYAFLVFISWV